MGQLENALLAGFNAISALSSGTLTYGTSSCTVFVANNRDNSKKMTDSGYWDQFDDLYVLAKKSDVVDWNLKPSLSQVSLDGVAHMVGRSINKNNAVWTIWLRKKN